jgi:hypothetical protein
VKILEYKEMESFFVRGESEEPRPAASCLSWIEALRRLGSDTQGDRAVRGSTLVTTEGENPSCE